MAKRNSGIQSIAFNSELQLNVETLKKLSICLPGPDLLLHYLGVAFSKNTTVGNMSNMEKNISDSNTFYKRPFKCMFKWIFQNMLAERGSFHSLTEDNPLIYTQYQNLRSKFGVIYSPKASRNNSFHGNYERKINNENQN